MVTNFWEIRSPQLQLSITKLHTLSFTVHLLLNIFFRCVSSGCGVEHRRHSITHTTSSPRIRAQILPRCRIHHQISAQNKIEHGTFPLTKDSSATGSSRLLCVWMNHRRRNATTTTETSPLQERSGGWDFTEKRTTAPPRLKHLQGST